MNAHLTSPVYKIYQKYLPEAGLTSRLSLHEMELVTKVQLIDLFAFHFILMPLGKAWTHLSPDQLII